MHEDAARSERAKKVEQGLSLVLQDTQRHLKYPLILNLQESLDLLMERYLEQEDILFMRGRKQTYKPKQASPTELFLELYLYRESGGVEVDEIAVTLLSESFVTRLYAPTMEVLENLVSKIPSMALMLPHLDIVAEYVLFWLSHDLSGLVRADGIDLGKRLLTTPAGEPFLLVESIEAPIWGDLREAVRVNIKLGGVPKVLIVPFSKAR